MPGSALATIFSTAPANVRRIFVGFRDGTELKRLWRELTTQVFSIRINQLKGHYSRKRWDAGWPNTSAFTPFCLEFPPRRLPSPRVISDSASLGRKGSLFGEGGHSCHPQPHRGHLGALARGTVTSEDAVKGTTLQHASGFPEALKAARAAAAPILNYQRCPPAGGEPVRVPPQRFPWRRRDLKQDSFLISRDGSSIHRAGRWRLNNKHSR